MLLYIYDTSSLQLIYNIFNTKGKYFMEEKKKFYQKSWFTVLLLVIFWPVGIIVMWTNKIFNMATRMIITVFFSLCIIISFSGKNNPFTFDEISTTEYTTIETTTETIIENTIETTTIKPVTITSVTEAPTAVAETLYTAPPETNNDNNNIATENIVYIGKTGNKYHKQSCSTLKGNGSSITLEEALAQGREPCKKCKP